MTIFSCKKLEKMFNSEYEQIKIKKIVYNNIFVNVFDSSTKIDNLKSGHIKNIFKIIDKIYFKNNIKNYLKKNNIKLDFKVSKKLTCTAGICKYITPTNYQIVLSSTIINNIFRDNTKVLKINGIKCFNSIECLINLFEHELVHLIIFLLCPELGKGHGGHTHTFKNIAHNIFGHTDYVHMLLTGDYDKYENKIKLIKQNLKIGNIINIKFKNGKIMMGYVIKLSNKKVKVILENGNIYIIGYGCIENIIKRHIKIFDNLIKEYNNQNNIKDTIKSNLNKNDIIKIKFKGDIINVKIKAINKKRLKVELKDGSLWYISYNHIIN